MCQKCFKNPFINDITVNSFCYFFLNISSSIHFTIILLFNIRLTFKEYFIVRTRYSTWKIAVSNFSTINNISPFKLSNQLIIIVLITIYSFVLSSKQRDIIFNTKNKKTQITISLSITVESLKINFKL